MNPPSDKHLLGTDSFGRDVFSRVIWGARVSLFIAAISMGQAAIIGSLIGMCAGFLGKAFDMIINWFVDIMMTFPVLIIGVMIAAMLGSGLIPTIVSITVAFTPRFIRLARGVTLSIREETFVKAALTYGQKKYKIIAFHIFPHIVTSIIVMTTIWTGVAIGIEASLSFLGLGVQPPTPSWGAMTQEYFTYVTRSMALPLYPGLAIAFTMYVLAMLGDKLQDLLNPRIKST
jgi:peptide/nickel transport system permease protein